MKSEEEIKDLISEIETDERLGYPDADVFTNAPLALVQLSLKSKIDTLKWVLGNE